MLVAKELKRVFIFKDKNQEIRMDDPEPSWSADAVLEYYANMYALTHPILTTAKVSAPVIHNDKLEYRFESVMGTKG